MTCAPKFLLDKDKIIECKCMYSLQMNVILHHKKKSNSGRNINKYKRLLVLCGVTFGKQCGTRFLLVCFKPYCCSSQHPTIQTDTFKTWMRSNTFIIFFNFCRSFTTSLNLHVTPTIFMLDNELQRIICTLPPR